MSSSERRRETAGGHVLDGADGQATNGAAAPPVLTLYSRPGCHLCEQAHAELMRLAPELGFELRERDISSDQDLHDAYFERIPVVVLDGVEICDLILDQEAVRAALNSPPRS